MRKFTGGGVQWLPGASISPEKAMEWPLANRKALYNTHKVEWFGPPVEEVPQNPAPPGTVKVEDPNGKQEDDNAKDTPTAKDADTKAPTKQPTDTAAKSSRRARGK